MGDRHSGGWQFGPYRFDGATGVLSRGERTTTLLPKDCLVLQVLLARSCQLVSKEELHHHCWPQQAAVGGDVLKTCIRRLRKTLDDDFHTPVYIETAGRRGYRFLLPATPPGKTASASIDFIDSPGRFCRQETGTGALGRGAQRGPGRWFRPACCQR